MKSHSFRVANLDFNLLIPSEVEVNEVIPSFVPFSVAFVQDPYFVVEAVSKLDYQKDSVLLFEDCDSDFGHVRLFKKEEGFYIELLFGETNIIHRVMISRDFTEVQAEIHWDDPSIGEVLSSILRIVFSQAILFVGGIAIHAAAVALDGYAFLFMGKSGTGKSTHAALGLDYFPKAKLLNDDNPILRLEGGKVVAYGSPWSGKTPCYKNESYPVYGIVRICQAKNNRFIKQEDIDAFVSVLPGCSAIRNEMRLYNLMCDNLVSIIGLVHVGRLECLPNEGAVVVCARGLGVIE